MNSLNEVKSSLKEIQKNFNPTKATYKIFEELINKNYSAEQMYKVLSKLHGVDKYPENIKNKYNNVLKKLKNIIEEQKRIANTNELKGIIDKLEQTIKINNLKLQNNLEEVEVLDEEINIEKEDNLELDINKQEEEILDDEIDEKTRFKLINRYLIIGVIVTFVIAILVFYLY